MVSVVIPAWNEESRIADSVRQFEGLPGAWERIVVDGGSGDRTLERARKAGAEIVARAPRGRAAQMNHGAGLASGRFLLFLHADVLLPRDAHALVVRALRGEAVAGCFRTWTESSGSGLRRAVVHLADLRSRYTSLPYGDQALFVSAARFTEVGGFPEVPLFEDLELSRRLKARGRLVTLPASVRVSGRRFDAGLVRATLLINLLPLAYWAGVPVGFLERLYGSPR